MLALNWPKMQLGFSLLCLLAIAGFALPLDPGRAKKPEDQKFPEVPKLPDIPGLDAEEYKRYWEEVVKNNPGLQERLSKLSPEKLANIHPRFAEQAARKPEEWMKNFRPEDVPNMHPHLGERLARSSEEIRSRLEEARRMNVDELRQLQKLQMMRENHPNPEAEWMARREAMREKLPPQFSHEQLQKRLEEQRKVLEDLDRKRREDFKRYEMQMEHQRRTKLKAMDEQHRIKAEEEFRQKHEKLAHHERLNQPASEQQFKEVWDEDDGLKEEDFDPRTFFNLHDTDGNGELDPMELEGLFYREVKKIFGSDVGGVEAHEEMARMREYAMQTVDKNHDGMISRDEFIRRTSETANEEWQPMVDQPDNYFSDEELEKFEENYDDYYDYDYDEDGNIVSKSHLEDLEEERELQQEQQIDKEGVPGDAPVHEEQQPARGGGGEEQAQEQQPVREGGEEQAQEKQNEEPRLNGDPAAQTLPEDQKMIVEALQHEKEGQAQQFVKDPQDHQAPQEQDEKRREQ